MMLFKKFFSRSITYLFYPVAFFLIIIIRLISPIYLIRWNCTVSTRIGHYVDNMNMYLCEKEIGKIKIKVKHLDIFYDREQVCNKQIQKMLRRKVIFLPWFIMHPISTLNEYFFDKIFDSKRKHDIGYYRELGKVEKNLVPPLYSWDNLNSVDQAKVQLFFNQNEIDDANQKMKKIGINPNDKVVSIILRDKDYLERNYKNINWLHHSLRDTDLGFYEKTIKYLIEQRIKVIVFGRKRENLKDEILKNESNVYFYEDILLKSDLMNIYLLYKSMFVISSVTGLDSVPASFKIPVIEVGVVPFCLQRTYSNLYLSLFKNYFSKTLNRNLTMKEIFENELFDIDGNSFLDDELNLVHPTEDDIKDACEEMMKKISKNYIQKNENIHNQEKFKKMYSNYIDKYCPYRSVNFNKGSVGESFLERNKFLIS